MCRYVCVNGVDSFLPLSEPNKDAISPQLLTNKKASLPLTFANNSPDSSLWVYTAFCTLNQNCGLCVNEAGMTEITGFCKIAQYPEEFTGAWKVTPQLSAHCY